MMETLPIQLFPQTTDGRAPGPLTTGEEQDRARDGFHQRL